METRVAAYQIGAASVGDYLNDLEARWGVKLAVDIRMMELMPGCDAMALTIGIPHPEHQAELNNPPNVSLFIGRLAEDNIWGAIWDALYEWDEGLTRHLAGL